MPEATRVPSRRASRDVATSNLVQLATQGCTSVNRHLLPHSGESAGQVSLNASLPSSSAAGRRSSRGQGRASGRPGEAGRRTRTTSHRSPGSGTKRRLIVFGAPVALAGLGSGLWFSGVVPSLLGIRHDPPTAEADAPSQPIYIDLPEIITNLNNNPPRTSYVKLTARLEVRNPKMPKRSRWRCPGCRTCS